MGVSCVPGEANGAEGILGWEAAEHYFGERQGEVGVSRERHRRRENYGTGEVGVLKRPVPRLLQTEQAMTNQPGYGVYLDNC